MLVKFINRQNKKITQEGKEYYKGASFKISRDVSKDTGSRKTKNPKEESGEQKVEKCL